MAPTSLDLWKGRSKLFDSLRHLYTKDKVAVTPPPISQRTAFLCAIAFTIFYVAPFYLSPTLRTNAITSRDAPSVIQARVRAVGLTCATCAVVAVYMLTIYAHATPLDLLRLCGIWPCDPLDILRVLALVMVLFTCSIYESVIVDGEWKEWSVSSFKEGVWDSWTGYRNLFIAPLSEELVFRALTIPLFLFTKMSPTRIVFFTPLVFGLAHVHHLFAFVHARTPADQRLPPSQVVIHGLLMSTFQFAYTSLFGFFAAFVFLRTGNFWAIVVAHSFCNHMGVPRLWGRVGSGAADAPVNTPDIAKVKRDDEGFDPVSPIRDDSSLAQDGSFDSKAAARRRPEGRSLIWTLLYYMLILIGAYGFYRLLFPLTESKNALASFHSVGS